MNKRVVVTGLGVVSPLGSTVNYAWDRLIQGGNGIQSLSLDTFKNIPSKVAALVKKGSEEGELDISKYVSKQDQRNLSSASIYALVAGSDALSDADWSPVDESSRRRTGVCIGMGMVDLENICETSDALKKGYSRVSPYFVPRILPNMAAGRISIKYGFHGPNHCVSTACATGCHAIGDAFTFIRRGLADVMVCGGTEACIGPLALAGFCRLRALSTAFNDTPHLASRPFDSKRDGFVIGEGAAVLILEELEHATRRGVKIYAEILGYGLSGDANHITSPHEDGVGAILAMTGALKDAQIDENNVSYINAHATSTPVGDNIELKAIKSLIKDTSNLAISSTKGAHGHLLGAAGCLETLFTVLACYHSILPPTINLENICDEGSGLNCVPNRLQKWTAERRIALKNSFGFGGTNASLCLSEFS